MYFDFPVEFVQGWKTRRRLRSYVVIVPGPGDKPAERLRKLANEAKLKNVPLTIAKVPGGPSDYKIAKDADVTVLMWKEGTVKANLAFKGMLNDADLNAIMAEIPKVLGD